MDEIDVKLVRLLSENSRATAVELSGKVDLSVPAINKRIARLQKEGKVRFTVQVDAEAAGKPITVFILLNLQSISATGKLLDYVASDPDVLECYAVTGEYDYILKVCAKDVKALDRKLKLLKQQKGVVKSNTLFSLMENKNSICVLPEEERANG